MKFDINKLLDLEYLNNLASNMDLEIRELNTSFLELYDFDKLKDISVDEIEKIFVQYGVGCLNIIQYLESDFIDVNWEFADLFFDDISYSEELKTSIKDAALKEVDELNKKLAEVNDNIKKKIELIQKDLETINLILRVLDVGTITSDIEVSKLFDFIMTQEYTDEERYVFSSNAARLLIAKNKELSIKSVDVDTESFEKQLDEIYETVDVIEETIDDKIKEPIYSETILGYYKFYKDIINEVGIGADLAEVMETSKAMANGIDSSLHSINRDDFCLELGLALYNLHNAQSKEKANQELITDALMDLAILDRIYEENEKNSEVKKELLLKIENDILGITSISFETGDSAFVQKNINVLNLLKIELKNNLIDNSGLNNIKRKYEKVNSDVTKIPTMVKQLKILNDLNVKIVSLMSLDYKNQNTLSNEDYAMISDLQVNVLRLIDEVKVKGYDANFDEKNQEFFVEFSKYLKTDDEVKKDMPIELKGFVLFDFDEKFVPYVINDLDLNNKNNLIDNSIVQKKLYSGFEDYSNLIKDLLIYGEPEIIHSGATNYYLYKILDSVYYDDNRNHPTGIVRIRPLRNSLVRFASKEVVLRPDTEIFRQVRDLIQQALPNVVIDESREFSIFINFSSAMKLTDKDSYVETIHRYDNRSALYNLFLANPDRTRLSEYECSLLKDIIVMSLDAYAELEKRNDKLNFPVINQIGGKKSRG